MRFRCGCAATLVDGYVGITNRNDSGTYRLAAVPIKKHTATGCLPNPHRPCCYPGLISINAGQSGADHNFPHGWFISMKWNWWCEEMLHKRTNGIVPLPVPALASNSGSSH